MFRWGIKGYSPIYGFFDIGKVGFDFADPFLLRDRYVIYESYRHDEKIGRIEYLDLATNKRKLLLDNQVHCSFPFLYTYKNRIFMVPEEQQLKKLSAYELLVDDIDGSINIVDELPICNGRSIVDCMMFFADGSYFALYNEDVGAIGDPGGVLKLSQFDHRTRQLSNEKLISCDVRYNRNAGSIKVFGSNILFVSQLKNTGSYGDGVLLHSLSLRDFRLKRRFKTFGVNFLNCHHIDWRQNSLGYVFDVKITY